MEGRMCIMAIQSFDNTIALTKKTTKSCNTILCGFRNTITSKLQIVNYIEVTRK